MERAELISCIRSHTKKEDWKDYGVVYDEESGQYETALFELPPGFIWQYKSTEHPGLDNSGWVIAKLGENYALDAIFNPLDRSEAFS